MKKIVLFALLLVPFAGVLGIGIKNGTNIPLSLSTKDSEQTYKGEEFSVPQIRQLLPGKTIINTAWRAEEIEIILKPDGLEEITRFGAFGRSTFEPPSIVVTNELETALPFAIQKGEWGYANPEASVGASYGEHVEKNFIKSNVEQNHSPARSVF